MGDRLHYYRPAIVYAGVLALVVLAAVTLDATTRPADPPSVVLITVDSLRADHLGIYGYERETSPHIDAFARRGVVFDNAFTVETLSGPSHASMFTSFYPSTHGVVYNGYELDDDAVTLAELLRDRGYRTAAFVSDVMVSGRFGLDQGFDRFELSQVPSTTRARLPAHENRSYHLARNWLRAHRAEPLFLWLHCQQPHFSYNPIAPYDRKFDPDIPADFPYRHFETMRLALDEGRLTPRDEDRVVALYDGEISVVDDLLGPIFDELREHHDRVLVILTSDHGDLMFEHGEPGLVGHGGGNFYDGAMRVPLIVVPPSDLARSAERVEGLASTIDLLPTIAAFAGIDPPPGIEGRSLEGLLDGSESELRDAVHAMYLRHVDRPTLALRTLDRKLIHRGGSRPRTELYDLAADPGELRDVSAANPDETRRLTERLSIWFDERPGRLSGAQRKLSPEIEELLRQGGYLDDDD